MLVSFLVYSFTLNMEAIPSIETLVDIHQTTRVISKKAERLDGLKTHIRNAISAIPADMLHRTWQELEYRLDVLRATKRAHIEFY
jgi:hypothetical protein